MTVLNDAMEDVHHRLQDSEREKSKWKQVEDVVLQNLQDEIDHVKVLVVNIIINTEKDY